MYYWYLSKQRHNLFCANKTSSDSGSDYPLWNIYTIYVDLNVHDLKHHKIHHSSTDSIVVYEKTGAEQYCIKTDFVIGHGTKSLNGTQKLDSRHKSGGRRDIANHPLPLFHPQRADHEDSIEK